MKQLQTGIAALVIVISALAHAPAQTPGYLGKKLSFYYDTYSWMGFHEPYDPTGNTTTKVHLNLRHAFSVDYVFEEQFAFGMSLSPITVKLADAAVYTEDGFSQYAFLGDVKIRGRLLGLYLKGFFGRNKGIAPLGAYHKFEFGFGKIYGKSGKLNPSLLDDYTILIEELEELEYDEKVPVWALTYTFGRQALYFDRFYVNGGASVSISPSMMKWAGNYTGTYYSNSEAEFYNDIETRFGGYMLFSINIGIGLLAL